MANRLLLLIALLCLAENVKSHDTDHIIVPDSIVDTSSQILSDNTSGDIETDGITAATSIRYHYNDSVIVPRKRPFKAALEVFGLNIGIWAFDRYVLQGDYARISLNTMESNLKNGFVWDNDGFATNLFSHPYAGGLYMVSARANGLNFYESMPYAIGGSLMWEFFMENEPAAINDLISTSIGGFALGESMYRLSDLIIDSRATGWERFGREFLATAISPMTGLNRILNGEAWKRRNFKGRAFGNIPAKVLVRTSYKAITNNTGVFDDVSNSLFVDASLYYGDPFAKENEKPYDYISFEAGFNLISDRQPLISNINAIGMLWGKNIELKKETREMVLGIFQHFDYYDSYADDGTNHFFRIAEAAAFGGGILYKAAIKKRNRLYIGAHLNGILLGASLTDRYHGIDRDYNLGSGYSTKLKVGTVFNNKLDLGLKFEEYRIFTWKGYPPNTDFENMTHEEALFLNSQGDKGVAFLDILSLELRYNLNKHLTLSSTLTYYYRKSRYDEHMEEYPDMVKYSVSEAKIGIGYLFQ